MSRCPPPYGPSFGGIDFGYITSDGEGRFSAAGLTPGIEYRLHYRSVRGVDYSGVLPRSFTLKPGETKELGEFKLKPMVPQ